jgi:uncharacterized protein (DUF1015 family)
MLRAKPFAALRPNPEHAAEVACVPYDVVNTSEARALAEGKPRSFLHVIRPEIDLPDTVDHYADEVYAAAARAFRRFQKEGTLVREDRECVYLYRQEMTLLGRTLRQTGIVCCCHIDDYNTNVIRKHEKTRKDKEDDRTRHVLTLNANAEPVFFLFQDDAALATLVASDVAKPALFDFVAPDGVRHTIWRCEHPQPYIAGFANIPVAYVADGHHRTASAARAGAERRAANPNHTGNEEYNWFLATLFPASELTILPYHRLVTDLNGMTSGDFLQRLSKVARVTPDAAPEPAARGHVSMYLGGKWHGVAFDPATINLNDPINSLDYVVLADRVLHPILGIGDIRTDQRIDFVGGIRGPGELKKRVDRGDGAVAFSMYPTSIDQLIAISDAGAIMPPKSTWFEPKLRSGLLVHTLE